MMTKKKKMWALLLAFAGLFTPAVVLAQVAGEEAAVRQAAMDYLDGFYQGDAELIRRGVHPDVVKYGFMPSRDGSGYDGMSMSFAEMIEFADGVKARGNHPPESAPKEVILLEVLDQTAAVKVIAWWGSDYLHLAKYDDEWKIIHVLWQSPPEA